MKNVEPEWLINHSEAASSEISSLFSSFIPTYPYLAQGHFSGHGKNKDWNYQPSGSWPNTFLSVHVCSHLFRCKFRNSVSPIFHSSFPPSFLFRSFLPFFTPSFLLPPSFLYSHFPFSFLPNLESVSPILPLPPSFPFSILPSFIPVSLFLSFLLFLLPSFPLREDCRGTLPGCFLV